MEITQEQREKIYFEEKTKRENGSDSGSFSTFLFLLLGSVAGLISIISAGANKPSSNKVSLEALRRAYSGLGPDDE